MADEPEEPPSTSKDFASTKAAIFETFNQLKKWREEQVEQFRNMQLLESQKLIRLSDENQKHFEKALEQRAKSPESGDTQKNYILDNSSVSLSAENNDFDGFNSLKESSISGHLQRCFDDSSQSSPSIYGNKVDCNIQNPPVLNGMHGSAFNEKIVIEKKDPLVKNVEQNCSSSKPKRQFLKKGTGLLRYMPKSATNRSAANRVRSKAHTISTSSPKKNAHLLQRTLKLKPAIRNTDAPAEHVKHIRFDIPNDVFKENDENDEPPVFKSATNVVKNKDNYGVNFVSPSSSYEEDCGTKEKLGVVSNSGNESLNLSKENRELEEFEMLENFAQNSSFNSDSSVVQRFIVHGEKTKAFGTNQKKNSCPSYENINGSPSKEKNLTSGNSLFSAKIGLSKCLEEVHARKQILQKAISDINPRIQSLQKEIFNDKQECLDDSDVSERCSTPVGDLSLEDRDLPTIPEDKSSIILLDPPAPSIESKDGIYSSGYKSCNINEDIYPNQNSMDELNSVFESTDLSPEKDQVLTDRLKIREKLHELENEIEIYQARNKKLSSICKERDEILRKLQKERDDFNKYKETEKKKLEADIQEERKQIRRQKETFTRYQKLRKDNPTRKEREELNALRQEVEKLQEDLKRQRIKYTSESRRMKNQLDDAERERDVIKLENIRLEEQVQDLLAALKARLKNNPETPLTQINKANEDNVNVVKDSSDEKQAENHTKTKDLTDLSRKSDQATSRGSVDKKTKTKVHFNMINGNQNIQENNVEVCAKEAENNFIENESVSEILKNDFLEKESISEISENSELDANMNAPKANDVLAANISTITVSMESEFREIAHGNKIERIYNNGEREIIFSSGTRKIICADGKTKFMFYNGDSKEVFPDKKEIYRYVNGVVETQFPDGLEVTEFPNGQIQRRYPDGQKEVKFPDSTVHNIYPDGSEQIRSSDGNVVKLSSDGTETIEFANGQKEIRTATYKRREFPDGSLKIIYDSGRQETRYANGRIRIKNKKGEIIVDTKHHNVLKD